MTNRERLVDMGWEDVVVFESPGYDSALVGVTSDGRAVYLYEEMVRSLAEEDGTSYEDAADFISFNALGSLGFEGCPVVITELIGDAQWPRG